MKTRSWVAVWLAVGGLLFLVCDASAKMPMQEKEHVQSIVWAVEFVTFITALAIAVFIWRLSKRDGKKHRSGKRPKPD